MADIPNRIFSFLVDKYTKLTAPTLEDKRLHCLQRLLLRVRVITEEAEERQITNQAMAHQLNILRKEMYRGYFIVDSLRSQGSNEEEKAKGSDVSPLFVPSIFNRYKITLFRTGDTHGDKDVQQVLDNLSVMIDNLSDVLIFLNNDPPLYRQPYSMHLFVGKCMFGRQMEMDRIMDFLMSKEQQYTKNVGVLPIIGPPGIGKSTLVAHVCNNIRVRNHFSQIIIVDGDSLDDEKLATLRDRAAIKNQNTSGENLRSLAIFELSRDVDEATWNILYLSCKKLFARGSKIMITSTSNNIIKMGTTQALVLNFLPPEAYWYFFKTLTFGSADSNDQPKLHSIAMEIARLMNGSFIEAYVQSNFLRSNLTAQNWYRHLATFKANIQRNVCMSSDDPRLKGKRSHRISKDELLIYLEHRACLSEDNVPEITMSDAVSGRVKCEGPFDVLAWKSQILPYKSYIITCIIQQESKSN